MVSNAHVVEQRLWTWRQYRWYVQVLGGLGGLGSMSKTPKISMNMDVLTQYYLFGRKIDKIGDISM